MSELIWVRATVHLPGLTVGSVVQVDPSRPYIADALEYGRLVREPEPPTESEAEGVATVGDGDDATEAPS